MKDDAGTSTYRDIEFGTTMGFRPVRMDVTVPAGATLPGPVVVYIHGGAFMFGSRRHGLLSEPVWHSLLQRGLVFEGVDVAPIITRSADFLAGRLR